MRGTYNVAPLLLLLIYFILCIMCVIIVIHVILWNYVEFCGIMFHLVLFL